MWMALLGLLLACLAGVCSARSMAPPHHWTMPTPDGRALFVMRAPDEKAGWLRNSDVAIGRRCTKSGLYPVGSSVPFWTVDWYAWPSQVVLSHSGEYVAVSFPMFTKDSHALFFCSKGKSIRTWGAEEVDPEQVRSLNAQTPRERSTRGYGWPEFGLRLNQATVSKDGYFELPTQSGHVAFSIATGEMLRKPQPPAIAPLKFPEDPVAYAEFCRVLGTTGTRNPNFVSGMPEDEWEWVEVPPARPLPAKPRHIMPQAPRSAATPPLAADATDWHLWLAVGTSLSFLACSSVLQLRKHPRRPRAFAAA